MSGAPSRSLSWLGVDWRDRSAELARRFAGAEPFPHVVLDGFLQPQLGRRLAAEFPPYDVGRFRNAYGQEGKAVYEDVRSLGPAFRAFDDLARCAPFRAWVGRVTGIGRLLYDNAYHGGGANEHRAGMGIWPHVDFNGHGSKPWRRRVNVLLYLNDGWRSEWGGQLELYKKPPRRAGAPDGAIDPVANRCVIFATTERSWHAMRPLRAPDDGRLSGRRSISLYYYTERPDRGFSRHETLWIYPSIPDTVAAGRELTAEDIAAINRALCLRDLELAEQALAQSPRAWKYPLPPRWAPGYRLSAADRGWLERRIEWAERALDLLRRFKTSWPEAPPAPPGAGPSGSGQDAEHRERLLDIAIGALKSARRRRPR